MIPAIGRRPRSLIGGLPDVFGMARPTRGPLLVVGVLVGGITYVDGQVAHLEATLTRILDQHDGRGHAGTADVGDLRPSRTRYGSRGPPHTDQRHRPGTGQPRGATGGSMTGPDQAAPEPEGDQITFRQFLEEFRAGGGSENSWRGLSGILRKLVVEFGDVPVNQITSRQIQGYLNRRRRASVIGLMGLSLRTPDHTTLSRRNRDVEVPHLSRDLGGPVHLVIDSTELKVFGDGEWQAYTHKSSNKRRCWRKLHLGIDGDG